MCTSSKQKKAEQTAAADVKTQQVKAGEEVNKAALEAQNKILEVGKQTPEETSRLSRYSSKATKPAENLMTDAGPISQAVSQRILERTKKPGMDFDANSADFEQGVGIPLWRSLKARGIAPPPGAEDGGGLGTQQYMKGAAPALAELRNNQINTDINRAENYGINSLEQQKFFAELENELAEAIRSRSIQTTEAGVPYGVEGATAKGQGAVSGATTNQAEVTSRYARQNAEKAAIGKMVAQLAMVAAAPFTGGASLMGVPAINSYGSSGGGGDLSSAVQSRSSQPQSYRLLNNGMPSDYSSQQLQLTRRSNR